MANKILNYCILISSLFVSSYIPLKTFGIDLNENHNVYNKKNEEEQNEVEYDKVLIEDLILELNQNISDYEKNKDNSYLELAIKNFGNLPKRALSINNNDKAIFQKVDYIFSKIKIYCYNLNTNSLREEYVVKLAESIFLGWKYNKNITYYKDIFLLEELINYNKNILPNIQSKLDYLKYVIEFLERNGDSNPKGDFIPTIMMPVPNPDEEYEDFIKDDIVEDYENTNNKDDIGNTKPDIDNNPDLDGFIQSGTTDSNVGNSPTSISTINRFEKKGNSCYKVEEIYSQGKLLKSNKTLANKSDYVKCGIYDYLNFGSSVITPNVEIDEEHIYQDQNEESSLYIYYTVTKNSKTPYYFNTGIRVDETTKSLTYSQMLDVLYQISIKENSFYLKDNNKSLFVIQGKPIVLKYNSLNLYSEAYINNLLKDFPNLGITIAEKDINETLINDIEVELDEESIIEKQYISNILINNKEFLEDNLVWIEDDSIKASINRLAVGLGAKVTELKNSLIISKDNKKIELFNNKKECYINELKTELDSKVYITNKNYIVDLKVITDSLGYIMDYNTENDTLTIIDKK